MESRFHNMRAFIFRVVASLLTSDASASVLDFSSGASRHDRPSAFGSASELAPHPHESVSSTCEDGERRFAAHGEWTNACRACSSWLCRRTLGTS